MPLVRRKTNTIYLTEEMVDPGEVELQAPEFPPKSSEPSRRSRFVELHDFWNILRKRLHPPVPGKGILVALLLAISFSWAIFSGESSSKNTNSESELISQLLTEKRKLELEVQSLKNKTSENQTDTSRSSVPSRPSDNSPISERVVSFDGSEKDDPFLGPKDSPLVMMLFSDFQCKLCREFNLQTLPRLREEYAGKSLLKIIFRDFPLANNSQAQAAATFGHCAGEQGMYWKAFDVLKAHPEEVAAGKFVALLRFLPEANTQAMNQCLKSVRYEKEIALDQQQGMLLGAKGAPSMFIGKRGTDQSYHGVFIRGAQPYPVIAQEIDRLLAAR